MFEELNNCAFRIFCRQNRTNNVEHTFTAPYAASPGLLTRSFTLPAATCRSGTVASAFLGLWSCPTSLGASAPFTPRAPASMHYQQGKLKYSWLKTSVNTPDTSLAEHPNMVPDWQTLFLFPHSTVVVIIWHWFLSISFVIIMAIAIIIIIIMEIINYLFIIRITTVRFSFSRKRKLTSATFNFSLRKKKTDENQCRWVSISHSLSLGFFFFFF